MADTTAAGSANDAAVLAQNNVAALEAALVIARERAKSQFFVDQVARMEAKVARAVEEVAGAQEALATAQVELAAEKERVAALDAASAGKAN